MKLPAEVQTTKADLILQKVGYGKGSAKEIDLTIRLDPEPGRMDPPLPWR